MATVVYKVEAPDGSIIKIEGPEGASQDELVSEASKYYESQKAPKPAKAAPEISTAQRVGIHAEALRDTWNDRKRYVGDALRSGAMGVADLALGAGQLASKFMGPEQSQRYGDAMRWVEQGYQEGREGNTPDVGRFTGSMVAGGLASKAPAAVTLGGRMLQGGKIGGALGLTQPVDPDADSYLLSKGIQVGGGTALGFVAPAAVEGIVRGTGAAINGLVNSVKGLKNTITGATNPANIEKALTAQLEQAGVAWNRVPKDAREMLIGEVQKAIRGGGTFDEEATRRLGDFLTLKMKPTQGQVTRDPLQFAREVNYSKNEFGKPLAERFNEQNNQLIGAVDELRAGTGARGLDPYAAGQNVISGLKATDAARKGTVDAAYTQARNLAGVDSEVPPQAVADRLGKIIEDFGDDKIPGAVMKRLNEFGFMGGKQTKSFSIREAEKLKTLIGNNIDNPSTPTGKALTLLKQGVDDAMNGIGDDAGAQAAGAFKQARGLAANRFNALDRSPALSKAVAGDATPDKFIESTIIRGSVDDVANTLRQLKPQDRAEVRAAILDWVKAKSVTGVEDTAKFTQGGYNKALQTLGERKLKLIFAGDKEALKQLNALGRVGAYVQAPPVASGVNYSNSATAGIDFIDQVSRLPGLHLISGRVGDMLRTAQAANAAGIATPTQAPQGLLPAGLLDRLAISGGLLSAPGAATAVPGVLENKSRKRIRGLLSLD